MSRQNSQTDQALQDTIDGLNKIITNDYTTVFNTAANNGDSGSTTDLKGSFVYDTTKWKSALTYVDALDPAVYNYASLVNASVSLDQLRDRYWYVWRARDHTAQVYGVDAIPSTAYATPDYQSSANEGSAVAYNNTNQEIVDDGTPATTYLHINGSTNGAVTFKFGNPLGQEFYSAAGGQPSYSGWSVFMVLKDIVRIGLFGRIFCIDSQLAALHGAGAYTPPDSDRNDALLFNHFNNTTNVDMATFFSNITVANSADTTGQTCVIGVRFNQITRNLSTYICTYEPVNKESVPTLIESTKYYEDTTPDILQYIRFGSNPSNSTESSRMKLYELIVINHAVENPAAIMLALNDEYKNS